jgi:hypothetical protein
MQYSVEIYINENGNRGDLAKDNSNNDLSWTNYNAVCSTQSCQQSVVTPGTWVTSTETLKNFDGTTLTWTPSAGSYFVVISVTSSVLGDPGNNELSVPVVVRNYFDVEVDLTWMEGGAPVAGSVDGSGAKDFQVSVSLNSPSNPSMTIRNASVEMTYTDVATGDASSFTVGHSSTVNIRETIGSGTPAQTGTRLIVGSNGLNGSHVGVAVGSITPPAVSSGQYSVTAILSEYVVYGPHSTCGGTGLDTVYCEKTVTSQDWQDEYPGSNEATIVGSIETFQDIGLAQFQIWKGLDGEDPEVFGSLGLDIDSALSPGDYELYAEVGHMSSSSALLYNWSVDFTLTDSSGTSTVVTANSCDSKVSYDNSQLGAATVKTPDAQMLVYACATVSMGEGDFEVKAEANLLGQWDEDGGILDDKVDDMLLSNNRYDFDVKVVNFAPQILSLTTDSESVTTDGDKSAFTATATVFDVEGDEVTYLWTDTSGNELDCGDNSPNVCEVTVDETMVPNFRFNLVVSDSYGANDNAQGEVAVWNYDSFNSDGSTAGASVMYEIVYKATGLGMTYSNVSDLVDVALPGYDGTYSSVGGVGISPSTTYDTKDVMSQTVTVIFANDIDATSMWIKVGNVWQLLNSGTPDEYDSTSSSYTYTWSEGSSMFTAGTEFYLFGGVLSQAQAPSANISGFNAVATIAGGIDISWNITGTMLSDDRVVVSICETDPQCTNPDQSSYTDQVTSMLYSGQNTVHGNTYHITASVCKSGLCSNEAYKNATADKEVASVTATDLTIVESGETWVLDWNASSEDSDIASWLVCFLKASFTASEMADLVGTSACVATTDTGATINKYTTAGTYNVHFAAAPVDVVGNIAMTASSDFIEYSRADDVSNPDDGSQTTDTEASSGVPTWTWGVIGIVVVVAFVAGAFILSRGDDGEDENKEWDY